MQKISDEAKDLILNMLEKNISNRIDAATALNHPFFAGVDTGEKIQKSSSYDAF